MKNIFTLVLLCLLLNFSVEAQTFIITNTNPADITMLSPGDNVTVDYRIEVNAPFGGTSNGCVSFESGQTTLTGDVGDLTGITFAAVATDGCPTAITSTCTAGASPAQTATNVRLSFTVGAGASGDLNLNINSTYYNSPTTCQMISSPITATVLPIALESMTGRQDGEVIALDWTTEWELNNDFFTIERSFDGIEFDEIGTVIGSGTTETSVDYQFIDRSATQIGGNGVAYYRLRQTDYDGTTAIAETISVELSSDKDFGITTIAQDGVSINVNYSALTEGTVTGIVYDLNGRPVAEGRNASREGFNVLTLDKGAMAPGFYLVQLTDGKNTVTRKVSIF